MKGGVWRKILIDGLWMAFGDGRRDIGFYLGGIMGFG
jgi:hypothetical protein